MILKIIAMLVGIALVVVGMGLVLLHVLFGDEGPFHGPYRRSNWQTAAYGSIAVIGCALLVWAVFA